MYRRREHIKSIFLFSLGVVFILSLSTVDTVIKCVHTISKRAKCYYGAYRNISDKKMCSDFPKHFEDNLRIVSNYHFNINPDYLTNLRLDNTGIELLDTDMRTPSTPVIATGASENHFNEMQAMLENIHFTLLPKYPDLKIIFFDFGLRQHSRILLQRHCKCKLRTFPFDEYPGHVSTLSSYTWKPIIIQLVLTEYQSVI